MKLEKTLLITLILATIFMIGAVSASDDFAHDNLTAQIDDAEIQDSSMDDDVLGRVVADEGDQNDSGQSEEQVLGSELDNEDIKIKANTKTVNATSGNSVLATIEIPKGHTCYLVTDGYLGDNNVKLSKLSKKTKNGIVIYTVRLKNLKNFHADDLKNNKPAQIFVKYYNVHEKGYVLTGNEYVLKYNSKAKTFKLKKKIQTQLWIGPYDRRSGTNKVLTVHLGIPTAKKPLCDSKSKHIPGKKVKIKINGVVYNKKTDSKGLIKIYPPKYLPPMDNCHVIMEFAGDDKYTSAWQDNGIQIYKNPGSSKSKITASSKTFSVNKTKKYTVKLQSNGKAIKKAKVKLVINGKNYAAKTGSNGKATFNISKLNKKGTFKSTVLFMGDKKHYMAYKNVKLTIK